MTPEMATMGCRCIVGCTVNPDCPQHGEDAYPTHIGSAHNQREDLSTHVFDLGVEMNRQRADGIRRMQEQRQLDKDLEFLRRESAIQAVQDRLERDLALAVGCTDYPVSLRKRAEEYVAAVVAQLGKD